MRQFWRQWVPDPKHGLARGVVVHGSPGFRKDDAQLTSLLADCRQLRAWAAERKITLDDSPDSLAALDHALSPASEDRRRGQLANDCGLYLGTVIVHHRPDARWHVWPNGHPVVRLAPGREVDVVAAVQNRADTGQLNLAALYGDAAR